MTWTEFIRYFPEWAQFLLNAGALLFGGVIWKLYIQNLKESISTKQNQIDAAKDQVAFWSQKYSELEKQSPAKIEKILEERIQIREKEIERLDLDRTESREELDRIRQEVELLNRKLEQAKGFRQMLSLEAIPSDHPDYQDYLKYLDSKRDEVVNIEVVYMGSVGVDSGQLMLTDPCYIDSQWIHEEFRDTRVYRDRLSGEEFQFRVDFQRFDENIEKYGLSPNQLIEDSVWEEIESQNLNSPLKYSYDGACRATLNEGFGELNYQNGNPGAGVVFQSGYGDGFYPVYGERHDGRIVRVYVNVGVDPLPADEL